MTTTTRCLLACALILGCSNDDDPTEMPPGEEGSPGGDAAIDESSAPACEDACEEGLTACGCPDAFGGGCVDEGAGQQCVGGRVSSCAGTENPWPDSGERCCEGRSLVNPYQGQCSQPDDLSPRIDEHGVYVADEESGFLASEAGVLTVQAAYVVDNGEGDDWPHGPHGNLYVDVFSCDESLDEVEDGADERRIAEELTLRGPHRTHDTTDEWLDDEAMFYRGAGIFAWDALDCVVIRVWESDSMSDDGNWLGRRNDVLCMERVERVDTEGASGRWYDCHKYDNEHPRGRLDDIAMHLLLQTPR